MPCAVCVVLADADGRVLLVRENYGMRRWGFPGGRVDEGEAPSEAARREAREEAGIEVAITLELGSLTWEDAGARWSATVFAGELQGGDAAIQDPSEISDLGWFAPGELPKSLTRTADAWARDALNLE